MTWKRTFRALLAVGVLGVGVTVAAPAGTPGAGAPAACTTLCAGGEYFPLTPSRIFDNRIGLNSPPGAKATSPSGPEFKVPLLGEGGIPEDADDVLAVVANVTVADPTLQGSLTIFPTGLDTPGTSSLVNYLPGRNVPNMAILGIGTDGTATVKLTTPAGNGTANVIVDVFGWIGTSAYDAGTGRGARLIDVGPGRIYDSREQGGPLGSRDTVEVPVRGAQFAGQSDGVPDSSSVTAVMVNLTGINNLAGSQPTNLALTPDRPPAGTTPETSNLNVIPGLVKAGMAIVPVGADGSIYLSNLNGPTNAAIDVLAILETGKSIDSRDGRIIPLTSPFRAFDTRNPDFGGVPLGFGSAENWSFEAFAESVTMPSGGSNIAVGKQRALIGNLTGTDLTRLYPSVPVTTFMSMYAADRARPEASTINVPEQENVPNMTLLPYGEVEGDPYTVQAYNHDGSIHYLFDAHAIVLAD